MERKANFQNLLIVLLAVTIIAMSIGFATYSSNLQISGTATFKKSSWSIVFDNLSVNDGSTLGTTTLSGNTLTYNVTMPLNSKYSFTVDAKNEGTIDAKLTGITFANNSPTNVTGTYGNQIGYTFTYDGQTYSANQTNLNIPLNAGASKEIEVTLEYPVANTSALPVSDDVTLSLGVTLSYESVE